MLPADWNALSQMVPGGALVVIFVLFTLRVLERQDKRDAARDAEFLRSIEKHDSTWQETSVRSDDKWRDALAVFQSAHTDSSNRMADEMRSITHLVTATNSLVAQHDTWERVEIERRLPQTKVE